MKKSIKNFIIMIAVTMSTFAFGPTFAMESNHKPSITTSQQVPTESKQIELITQYQLQLKDKLKVLNRILDEYSDSDYTKEKQALQNTTTGITNEIDDNEAYIKKLQESAKLKAKDDKNSHLNKTK